MSGKGFCRHRSGVGRGTGCFRKIRWSIAVCEAGAGVGFSLEEIRELLALRASPRADCGQVRERAERKREELDGKITELRRLRRALDKLIAECSGEGPVSRCTILTSLEENS